MAEELILVDEFDHAVGIAEKVTAHARGMLHRAFSAVVLNSRGQVLLQLRAPTKYHSGGLWSNTCCGHPRPGESVSGAARRRLWEEMGIDCHLEEIFVLRYQIELDSGMTENEYDHVLLGQGDDLSPSPDSEEVSDWKWCDLEDLWTDMSNSPEHYTSWFKILAEEMKRRNVA